MSTPANIDAWGSPVAGTATSIAAWNDAWTEALHFVGDPLATLAEPNETDEDFALGSVFCGIYRLLGGAPPDTPEVQVDIERATRRSSTARELGHVEALGLFASGEFTAAAKRWDEVNRVARDFAAVRFAHDVYLHVGNVEDRLSSSALAVGMFNTDPGWNLVASQYAFSLEEACHFAEAERIGLQALDVDPQDLWATHCLAHVYLETGRHDEGLSFLRERQDTWSVQDGLAVHIWWHFALHLIARGEFDEVLDIHDRCLPDSATPFRLSDLISLLWRLEANGVDVGDRWDSLADAMAARPERHTTGFLDLHSALLFSRLPDHWAAEDFFAGLASAYPEQSNENATTFHEVVRPLATALRTSDADPIAAIETLDELGPILHRIGGSNAQREIVHLTRTNLAEETT